MQVVIDVPNWLYHAIQEHREPIYSQSLGEAVRDGILYVKPKGIEQIRAEVESINVWALRYAPSEDKDIRPQIVTRVKSHVLEIIDKYKAEGEE